MDILVEKIDKILNEKKIKIRPENIKKDVNILGIIGTYEGQKPSGTINIVQNGTVDVSNYASADVNVPTPSPNLQNKSIEITENGTQTITADSGYDGLDEVEITTNISGGGDASEYFNATIGSGSGSGNNTIPGFALALKKVPPGLVAGSSAAYMFNRCSSLEEVTNLDTSNTTNMNYMFRNCGKLNKIENFDTKKVNDFTYMFYSCSNLVSVPLFDMSASNIVLNFMFQYCSKLENVPQFNTSNVKNMMNTFQGCAKLSDESLNNILAMCINATNYSNTKTLAYIGLTSAQADTCQSLSNWDDFVAEGWASGY